VGRREPGRRGQPGGQLAAGSLVQRRVERKRERLQPGRGNQLDDSTDQRRVRHRSGQVQPLHRRHGGQRRRLRASDRPMGLVLSQRRGAPGGARDQRLERGQRRADLALVRQGGELGGSGGRQVRQPGELLQRQGDPDRGSDRFAVRLRHLAAHRGSQREGQRAGQARGRPPSGRSPGSPVRPTTAPPTTR
jgi:hypothetical protein